MSNGASARGQEMPFSSANCSTAAAPNLRLDLAGGERAPADRQPQWATQQLGVGELRARPACAIVIDDVETERAELLVELVGCPLRLTVGGRTLASGEVEAQVRRGRETRSVPLEGAAEAAHELWKTLP